MTAKQVAEKLSMHVSDVRRLLESGELHGHQKAKNCKWLVDPACVDNWVLDRQSKAACVCQKLPTTLRRAS